ncbi:MAG: PEP/pyruvate-binding domain-containing protein [Sphaerochaetaceae bacterium]
MKPLLSERNPFEDLMLKHIYRIILVCSEYDQFLIEEDGRVEEELFREYTQLGLSNPPKFTYARDKQEVIDLLATNSFDLVITMLELGNTSVLDLTVSIKKQYPAIPVIALSPSPAHRVSQDIKKRNVPDVDYLYYWQGNANLFLAMVKLLEDKMNAVHDALAIAEVPVIILVENSVRFYSSYLPILYTCIIQQTRISMSEGLNPWAKALSMRGRPKILLAQNYEEAVGIYNTFRGRVLGIISDISFDRKGVGDPEAGLRYCEYIRQESLDIPILLQSTKYDFAATAATYKASFIWKLSPSLLSDLRQYVFENYGFGPFIFRDSTTHEEIARAETLKDIQHIIPTVPIQCFIDHADRNDFSRWLKARSLFTLANIIRPMAIHDYQDPEELRTLLVDTIKDFRMSRGKGVIAQFDRTGYDELSFFTRIGSGSLGGKGRGLAFIDYQVRKSGIIEKYPDMYLSIPRTVVIATDLFTQFMEENSLQEVVGASLPDETLRRIFLSKPLPTELMSDLEAIIKVIKVPMAVRSSGLLEDSHYQPFAGVYETCMLPNRGTDGERLAALAQAIICVYASTYYNKSKEYLRATNHMIEDERMAVVIQQVIGSGHGDYWYPNFAGVARSLNFYPVGSEKAEDGVGMLCFGFGKSVVDNGMAFRFSPRFPKRNLQYLGGMESSSQTEFYGLDISKPFAPTGNPENLVMIPLSEAEKYPETLRHIASTYDKSTGTLVDQLSAEGQKVITFNSILKYNSFPIASIVRDILILGEQAMKTPIEIEFAGNLNRPDWKKPEFSLLQIRPIVSGAEASDLHITPDEQHNAWIMSNHVMGNGHNETVHDIVYIKTSSFNPAQSADMAYEIETINAKFIKSGTEYLLVVAGRLGSSDHWLGVPVIWAQISQASIIVETSLPGFQVEPSQGTHFFQNITSLGTIYLTVNPHHNDGVCDFTLFDTLPLIEETTHFRHVRATRPFMVKADGRNRLGVVLPKPEPKEDGLPGY